MLVTKKPQPARVGEFVDTGVPILSLQNTYRPLLETPRKVDHARRLKHLADLELLASCPLDVAAALLSRMVLASKSLPLGSEARGIGNYRVQGTE